MTTQPISADRVQAFVDFLHSAAWFEANCKRCRAWRDGSCPWVIELSRAHRRDRMISRECAEAIGYPSARAAQGEIPREWSCAIKQEEAKP